MNLRTLLLGAIACLPALATVPAHAGDFPIQELTHTPHAFVPPATLDLDGLLELVAAQRPGAPLQAVAPTLSTDVAQRAMKAVDCAAEAGQEVGTLVVVDMGLHAQRKRLWAFDLADPDNPRLITNSRVAHGSGSDPDGDGVAERFSNTPNSHMTSMGLYRVAERYFGSSGWSRRLDGMFAGFNSNARDRAVVMHPAKYVSARRVGRSQGCPAVDQATMDTLEKAGLDNAVLWIDAPNPKLEKAVADCSAKRQERLAAQRIERMRQDLADADQARLVAQLSPAITPGTATSSQAWLADAWAAPCPMPAQRVLACRLTIPRAPSQSGDEQLAARNFPRLEDLA